MRAIFRSEKGSVLLLVSIVFTGLLMITGLVLDGGTFYMTKTHLQKVANAAALSGAQELTSSSQENVKAIVDEILSFHDESSALKQVDVVLTDHVKVALEKPTNLVFSSLFGIDSIIIKASATARLGVMGRAKGAAPLGIDESIPLEFGKIYDLKVDETNVDTGNFGIFALEDPGAKSYKENLLNGFEHEIKAGDIIDTQTGNVAGPTKEAVNTLVSSCNDPNDRSCGRVLKILVYEPYQHDQNQLMQVKIKGFAYFYITEPFNDQDKTVKGYFLSRTGTGFEEPDAINRGAYSIRLTE
jgi:hypothetical protein